MLSTCNKVYAIILEQRLKKVVERQLDQSHTGFQKGRSIHDHILMIKQSAEKAKDTNKTIYVAFIAFVKPLGKVPRNEIKNRNVNNKSKQAILRLQEITLELIARNHGNLWSKKV